MQGHLRSFAHSNAREHKHIQLRRIWLWSFRIFHLCLSLPQAWEQAIDSPGNQQLIRCGECRHVWSYSSLKSHLHILLPPPTPASKMLWQSPRRFKRSPFPLLQPSKNALMISCQYRTVLGRGKKNKKKQLCSLFQNTDVRSWTFMIPCSFSLILVQCSGCTSLLQLNYMCVHYRSKLWGH